MAGPLWWLKTRKGESRALLGYVTPYISMYHVIRAGGGPGEMGVESRAAPLAQSEAPPSPPESGQRGAMPGPSWDLLGSYLHLSAHGEERSWRATVCGLKVIRQLEQETKLSARQARRGAAPEVHTGCKDLGWAGGRARWQPSRTAMLISAAAPCWKNRELGSALGFPPPALRFR